jgi:hypothetical protein
LTCTIGYFEGTDSFLLTKLYVKGHGTMPCSNHWDHHGKLVSLLKKGEIKALVGYVHKVLPPTHKERPTPFNLLHTCKTHEIPVFLIAPEGCEEECEELLGTDTLEFVHLVTPETVEEELDKAL